MNKDELKGKIENLKGRAKQAFGAASGDKSTEAEGAFERGKGAVQEKYGEIKEDIGGDRRRADANTDDDIESVDDDPAIRRTTLDDEDED